MSLSWGQATALCVHPSPADAAPVSAGLKASALHPQQCGCACVVMGSGPESPGAVAASHRALDGVCREPGQSFHLLAIRFLSVPKGTAVSRPHLQLRVVLLTLSSPQHYPCFSCAPHLLQPSSAADGHHPPDACSKFTAAAYLPCRSSLQLPMCWGHIYTSMGGFGLHCAPSVPALGQDCGSSCWGGAGPGGVNGKRGCPLASTRCRGNRRAQLCSPTQAWTPNPSL